jgi:hypothetical protein
MVSSGMLVFLCSVRRLLVTASVVPSSPILVALMKEKSHMANIPEDIILHNIPYSLSHLVEQILHE